MKTLLIPVDFSDVTENVLKYAADFSCDTHIERIILLKSFYVSIYAQLLPSADFVQLSAEDIDREREKVISDLETLSHELLRKCNPSVKIKTAISELPIARATHELIADEKPYMIMIGSNPDLDDSYIDDQIIAIGKTSPIPVFIVPSSVTYKKIEKALVPCDFSAISRLEALKGFRDPSKWLHPELIVLNVDPRQKHKKGDTHLVPGLVELLEGYDYQVHYSEDKDTVHGILDFAEHHRTQLIIALPGKYSFFYNLTHRSITNALALNTSKPVLILK
ncbi:MAG TPA: universal stress protein [Mucilaginibacter sp.]|jgi:nucleotide-binding universal stress UspA family protein